MLGTRKFLLIALLPVISASLVFADIWGELEEEAGSRDGSQLQRARDAAEPSEFDLYREQQQKEFESYKKIFEEEFESYQAAIRKRWDVAEVSTSKVWVSYTDDYAVKRAVDFENNQLKITAQGFAGNEKAARAKFESQIRKVLTTTVSDAFAGDQYFSSVEQRIKREGVKAKTAKVPDSSLFGLPGDKEKSRALEAKIKALASKLELKPAENGKAVSATVNLAELVPEAKPKPMPTRGKEIVLVPERASNYSARILAESERRDVEASLLLAVIHTESAFNPMARSQVPAYGLMQIVPTTAGLDATEYVYGKQTLLAPSALYDPEQNIELGAAYLWILNNRYLRKIENPLSRYYCVVAAYNTGAGNVAKAFTGRRNVTEAAPIINKMSPDEVYAHLIKNLPYDETKNYLKKVVTRAEGYRKTKKS